MGVSRKERIHALRDDYNAARRKGKTSAALKALQELEALEPEEPRWPHQRGDLLRREGRGAEAADAFEKATDLYAAEGFVARAVAMAKTLLQVDPSRTEVLDRVDPSVARKAHREARPHSGELRAVGRSMVEEAPKLEPSPTASADEIRFLDIELVEEEEIMELDVSELELIDEPPLPSLSLVPEAPEPPASARLDRLALMPSFPLFSELPPSRLRRLAQGADLVELPPRATVVQKGEPADALYCVVDGRVRVEIAALPPAQRPHLGEGDVFGESVLLEHAVRQTDVVTVEPLVALRIPRAVLDEVVEGVPMLDDLLFELLARRLLANFLGTSPLFTPFSPTDRRELAKRFEVRRADPGTTLMAEGKRCDGLYVLVQGRLSISRPGGVEDRGPGSIFGIRAMIHRAPATATATTLTECVLLRLPEARFTAFVASFPPALAHLAEIAAGARALDGDTLS